MIIRMNNLERLTLAEMEEFVAGNDQVDWTVVKGESLYGLIERVLKAQQYSRISKGQKGTVRRYLNKVTALSRAQLTRLIKRWMDTPQIERKPSRRPNFTKKYTAADVGLLARVDGAHEDLSGPAIRHILKRGLAYGDETFRRLADISPSHIYNLRKSAIYKKIRVRVEHTQARKVSIA